MNKKLTSWEGRHIWIIGASKGIGAATARLLLDRGAYVAVSARSQEELELMYGEQPHALAASLDITSHDSVIRARDQIMSVWPRMDLILVVAGTYNEMRAESFSLSTANHIIDVNLRGVFNCIDATLPVLLKQRDGGIGIVASVAGFGGLPKALVYGPTKAALINLSESLYLDLRPMGINVYQINPGFVDTPLTAGNDFKMPALITAGEAAHEIVRGIEKGRFHIHFPKRFTRTLLVLSLLPYRLYFWLVHRITGL
ncbi:SDR family NAD(P)-dependent oxidoreductase [Undibacterium sp. TJN25]|uniref:SDR family NAD(P)-dependent oxidoreductase n=1 Tax=Undibacterium sp. TJN25 TaxID=3413056 RepID=UPI003BF42047